MFESQNLNTPPFSLRQGIKSKNFCCSQQIFWHCRLNF